MNTHMALHGEELGRKGEGAERAGLAAYRMPALAGLCGQKSIRSSNTLVPMLALQLIATPVPTACSLPGRRGSSAGIQPAAHGGRAQQQHAAAGSTSTGLSLLAEIPPAAA
eukprot:SAG25_NODE_52_length_18732_cov_99.030484_13_plen_111_part_00